MGHDPSWVVFDFVDLWEKKDTVVDGRASSGSTSEHQFGWRDMYDVIIKWRQFSEVSMTHHGLRISPKSIMTHRGLSSLIKTFSRTILFGGLTYFLLNNLKKDLEVTLRCSLVRRKSFVTFLCSKGVYPPLYPINYKSKLVCVPPLCRSIEKVDFLEGLFLL
jgi:hypothetical protein